MPLLYVPQTVSLWYQNAVFSGKFHLIPFVNKRLSLTKTWFVVAQFIARLTGECLIAFQNLYNATLFFGFGITEPLTVKIA